MGSSNLDIKITTNDQRVDAKLTGKLDGTSDYSAVPIKDIAHLALDFEGITLIDSVGVQAWSKFMNSIDPSINITFTRCSVRIINQMNMFKGFCGGKNVTVESFFAPYYCESCDESNDFLVESGPVMAAGASSAPAMSCPKCSQGMEFDGVEARYFTFLKSAA